MASAYNTMYVHGFPMASKACFMNLKKDNKPLVSLATSSASALGVICAIALCTMCIRHTLYDPTTEEVAFIVGDAQQCGIKTHINSGASRHFMCDVRLFASCDEAALNITFSTVAGVQINSR